MQSSVLEEKRKEKHKERLYFLKTFINQNKELWMQKWNTITKSILNGGKKPQKTWTFWGLKGEILTYDLKKAFPEIKIERGYDREKSPRDCFHKWFGIEIIYTAYILPLRARWEIYGTV